jgi:hypothetical protein
MPTFVLERVIPPAFDISNPDQVALHSRWATDAYQAASIVWLGGAATDKGNMYSLVVADDVDAIKRYCALLGIQEADYKVSEVRTLVGPQMAMSRKDPRYRAPRGP